jgi:uncharacterized flavoprotein (TIGR03862 family)
VVVVGGGPAGLMAAEVLAAAGVRVTLFDHMPSVGRKLLLAGRGGLNITHSEPIDALLARYGVGRSIVESAVRSFTPSDLRAWCDGLGEPTFIGSSGRVFPRSFRATPLLRAWLRRLAEAGVVIETGHRWVGWPTGADGAVRGTLDGTGALVSHGGTTTTVSADAVVLALGGASWPRVGSDGGWVPVVRAAGVEVHDLVASNSGVHVEWTADFAARFGGVPLKNVAVSVDGVTVRGDAMITATGLEGGPIYAVGAAARESVGREGSCVIELDLQPDLTGAAIAERIARRPKDSISTSLARLGLAPSSVALLREATANRVPRDAHRLAALVKALPVVVDGIAPIDRAISSAGGIALDEVDEHGMLRRVPGTFVAGEMLDWDAPTGGYLLQASLSTGAAAARGVFARLAASVEQGATR